MSGTALDTSRSEAQSSQNGSNPHKSRAWESKGATPGSSDSLGAGDAYVVLDVLGDELCQVSFEKVRDEVQWAVMHHRGGEVPRLVAVQGEVSSDGDIPIYRHPADESPPLLPFTPTVELIRQRVQKVIKHPVNHALIQYYRSGKDYISEHSDKTIDVVHGSSIVNVSLGAQRVMTLRTKKDQKDDEIHGNASDSGGGLTKRTAQRIPLPHGSMFVMGLETNRRWLHGINHDNRPIKLKSPEERHQGGERISLTFRHIGTFLTGSGSQQFIYGQGATGKTRVEARPVVNGPKEAKPLISAFAKENHQSHFDWDQWYGRGYDVLDFTANDAS